MKNLLLTLLLFCGLACAQVTISGGTTGGNIYPSNTGQQLGNSTQRWDAYLQNLYLSSSFYVGSALTSDGTCVNNKLCVWNGTTWTLAATTDIGSMTQIVASGGTTTSIYLYVYGIIPCTFDGATTNGNWVIVSTTVAGDCKDSGVAQTSNPPSGVRVLGVALSTNASGGTYSMFWNPFYVRTTTGVFNTTSGVYPINSSGSFVDGHIDELTNSGKLTATEEFVFSNCGTGVNDLGVWFGLISSKVGITCGSGNIVFNIGGQPVLGLTIAGGVLGNHVAAGTGIAMTASIFGTGTASNTDSAGQCTLGTNCVITFSTTYTSAPICVATDTTSAAATKVAVTTSQLTITGTGTDVINYICMVRN